MSSWHDVERQFRDLETALEQSRLERQWNTASEEWRLGGRMDIEAAKRFHAAAGAAGALLADAGAAIPDEVTSAPDAETRWFRALWLMGGPHDPPVVGMMSMHGTASGGPVSLGRVRKPAHASAVLARRFQAGTPG